MEINRLRHFIVVAEELNLTKASKRLFLSQPTLSRQIASLEEDIGFPLFFREKNKLELTPEGSVFVLECKNIINQFDSFLDQTRNKHNFIYPLTIGFHGSSEFRILAQITKPFNEDVHKVSLQFITGYFSILIALLYDDSIDMAILPIDCIPNTEGLRWITLLDNHLGVILPKTHPLAAKNTVKLEELAKENFILNTRDFAFQNSLFNMFKRNGFNPNIAYYENDTYVRMLRIMAGQGIGLMSLIFAEQYPNDIAFVNIEGYDHKSDIVIVWKEQNSNPAIPLFIKEIKKILLMEKA